MFESWLKKQKNQLLKLGPKTVLLELTTQPGQCSRGCNIGVLPDPSPIEKISYSPEGPFIFFIPRPSDLKLRPCLKNKT